MTRYIATEVENPIQSNKRDPRAAVIPPFSFVGELEIGVSGYWYPTSTMELQKASISASGAGTATAVISILKQEPLVPDPWELARISLAATQTKRIFWMKDVVVTPYDKIFITSWVDSGHTGFVVQLTGVLMS